MQRFGLTALNWVWACRGGLELGVGMQIEVGFKLGAGM